MVKGKRGSGYRWRGKVEEDRVVVLVGVVKLQVEIGRVC